MILYIHPKTNMLLKQIIPMLMSAIANRLRERWEFLARFHDEWTVDEVRRASLVIWTFTGIFPSFRHGSIPPGSRL